MTESPASPGNRIPPGTVCLEDYRHHAREVLAHDVFEYLDSGSADELTLCANRDAFDALRIMPRVLSDCSEGSTALTLLGQPFRHPILLAPVAHQGLLHADAELATAEAATALDAGMVVSTLSSVPMEAIAARLPQRKWFQLYFQHDRALTLALVRRAEAAGFGALVVTVDAPVAGVRNRIQRAGFALPPSVVEANLQAQPAPPRRHLTAEQSVIFQGMMAEAPTWPDMQWLREQTSLPIIVKGVMHPADAQRCIEYGFQGVVVSNHGGRCLDTVPATIQLVQRVRAAVGDEALVLLDGGVRRGTDVFKALALGADAVMIGRPQAFALAVAGPMGVAHVVKLLREELEMCMALSGCATPAAIDEHALVSAGQQEGRPACWW